MKIILCESRIKLEQLKKKEGLIPQVVEKVFSICKEDENFSMQADIESLEERITILKQKNKKQDSLLTQSGELKSNLLSKVKNVEEQCFSIKVKLLEALGSDI